MSTERIPAWYLYGSEKGYSQVLYWTGAFWSATNDPRGAEIPYLEKILGTNTFTIRMVPGKDLAPVGQVPLANNERVQK